MKKIILVIAIISIYESLFYWLQEAKVLDALLSGGQDVGVWTFAGIVSFLFLRIVIFLGLPSFSGALLLYKVGLWSMKR